MVGKEIKVTLSLDDSGFSIKTKVAGEGVRNLEKNLGGLTSQVNKTESALSNAGQSVKGFADGFGALEKSLASSVATLTNTVANSFNMLATQSKQATKQVKDEATAAIDAKMRVLKTEIETNRQLLQQRGKMHADMRKVESDANAKALALELEAEKLRRSKKAGSAVAAASKEDEAARYRASAEAIKAQVAAVEQSINATRTEQATRNSLIASLEAERVAAVAAAQAKRQLASVSTAVGRSNDAEIARIRAAAAQRDAAAGAQQKKSAEDMARYKKQLADQEVRDARAAETERTRAAREAAAERRRIAAEEARAVRAEAKAIADMWKGMAKVYAGSKIRQGLDSSVDAADDSERSRIMVQALNLPKSEEQALFSKAQRMSGQLGFASTTDVIKSQMSAISSLGYNHTGVIDDTLGQAMKAANNMELLGFGHGDMQSTLRNIYGVAEMRQQTGDSGAILKTFDLLNKSLVGTAGKVTLADVETVLRRVGAGAARLSDDGLVNLVGLADQFKVAGGDGGNGGGVSTVGTIIKMMQAYATGKGKSNKAVEQFAGAGILDEKGLDLSKDDAGVMKLAKNGTFKNVDLWLKDPVKAMQEMVPQIVAYTRKDANRKSFYQGRDDSLVENQMLAVQVYLQKLGITQSAATAVTSVGTPAAAERLHHQSATINNSDTVDQTALRLQEAYAGKVKDATAAWTNFKTVVGDSVLPVIKTVLDYVTKFVISLKTFAQNNPLATTATTIGAAFAGVVLSIQGFLSLFGSNGVMGAIRSFIGLAPAVAAGTGIMGTALKTLGTVFKGVMAVFLAWDIGYMLGTWLSEVDLFGITIGQHFQNIFTNIEVGWKELVLNGEQIWAKLRNLSFIDSDDEYAKKTADIEARKKVLADYQKMMIITPENSKPQAPPKKPLTKATDHKVDDPKPIDEDFADRMKDAANKPKRERAERDPLMKALGEEQGRMNAAKTKLDSLVAGGETLESLRQQAIDLVRGKWEAGDYSKDHSAAEKDRPDWNGKKMQDLVEATQNAMLYSEQVKAIQYANERVAATALEANASLNLLEKGGVAKQTDAFKALSKELARTEERLGAGVDGFKKWDLAKSEALFGQARSDTNSFAMSYIDKNREGNAGLLPTERARLKAQLDAQRQNEEAQIAMRQDTLRKTYQMNRDALETADLGPGIETEEKRQEKITALDALYQRERDETDKVYNERRRIRNEEEIRQLESSADKLAREWKDTYKAVDQAGVNAMDSFTSMLTNTLTSGKLEVGNFVKGILTDIANAKIKETLADPLKQLVNTGTNYLNKTLFGGAGSAADTASAAKKMAAETAATTATTSMSSTIVTMVIPALQMMAQSAAQASGSNLGFGLGSMIGSAGASSGAIENVLFANGGIMTDMGPLELRKYANGGIATSPQVAIYGEAGPEAYVPLPDGRSIPVTMKVQGGSQAAAAPSVAVNVINQTSQSVNAQQSGGLRFDGKQYVLDVVLQAATQPGAFRSSMKDALK
ncbi:phage tail tape measure C-terminal domain-containing protein [Massilia sp. TN1-12]|uniref:phage tail tape measure C-terminal domain-containing protein n=1 Tax=Massilia paldalensis TaxID=3377675 RepID=UPI0038511D1F